MENPASSEAEAHDETEAQHTTVETLALQLQAALGVAQIQSLSIHDRGGDPVWMSCDVVGPDEQAVATEALTVFEIEGDRAVVCERLTEDLGVALFSITSANNELRGLAMLIAGADSIDAVGPNKLVTAKVRSILKRLSIVMKPVSAIAGKRPQAVLPRPVKPLPNPFEIAATPPAAPAPFEPRIEKPHVVVASPAVAASISLPPPRTSTGNTVRTLALKTAEDRSPTVPRLEALREISLHVQQLMKLRSGGRTRRYEVLVRAKHSAAGEKMDDDLVRALSLRESAAAVDRQVVSELARWLKHNPSVWNHDPASFSVNLSLGSLLDPLFSGFIAQQLLASGVAPDTIGFEIQESAFLKHRDAVARFILDCEKAGCYIVVDDFTMHSDVVPFLSSRAVRVIKVDSNLTVAAMNDRLSQAIVIAISQASKVLGLHCVAKRIESTASRQWLAAVGIDFAQGYVLEDPRPIDTLATAAAQKQSAPRAR